MEKEDFQHRKSGRRPATMVALAASAGFLAFAVRSGAPWWFYPPILSAVALSAYVVLFNPQSGMRLSDHQIVVFSGRWTRTLDVAGVDRVLITEWSEGPPTAQITMKEGATIDVPSMCLPPRKELEAALRRRGVALG